jgi:acyl-CoA thioesterase FadM
MSTRLQVRPNECDRFGHVNNAVYASYLQFALAQELTRLGYAQDWGRDGGYFWMPRSLTIEYRQAAKFGDELGARLWLDRPDARYPSFGFEIERRGDGPGSGRPASIVRARSAWQRLLRGTGEPASLPQSVLAGLPAKAGRLPRGFQLPPDSPGPKRYAWDHTVMRAEVGPSDHAHPQALYQWLEEAIFDACDQSGWTLERRIATGYLVFQTRHDTEFVALPQVGDPVRVTSWLVDVRRLRGTWLQEVRKLPGRDPLVRDYSTGVFLDLEGRPAAPPKAMMEEIQFGKVPT